MRTRRPPTVAALLGLVLLAAAERPARADEAATIITVGVVAGAVDLGFGIYDTTVLARHQLPAKGAAVGQLVVALPQVGYFHFVQVVVGGYAGAQDDPTYVAVALLPGVPDALLMHGTWGAVTTTARPDVLYGVSAAVGFDTALTTAALSYAGRGCTEGRFLGAGAMILTAPQIAASAYAIVKDPANRPWWGALAGVSGAHFAYGLVSTAAPNPCAPARVPHEPPPQPMPALLVPGSIRVAPAALAGAPGIVLQGRWL